MTSGRGPESDVLEFDPGLDVDVLRRRRERALTIAALTAIFAITGVAGWFALRPERVDRRVLTAAAQKTVRETIGGEEAFNFGDPAQVEAQADKEFQVRGEVVAISPSTLRARHFWYDCLLRRRPDGSWGPARLTLLPQ